MSCYICIENELRDPLPGWELSMACNRDYASMYCNLPHETLPDDDFDLADEMIRPTDFAAWREAIRSAGFLNREAHLRLMDILERDRQWWIRVAW